MNAFKPVDSNEILYDAILDGKLNNEEIMVRGNGTINNGITNGNYDLDKFPYAIDPQILKIVLITGYPNACSSISGEPNIFGDESYTYKRTVDFSNGGRFQITVRCDRDGSHLDSHFHLEGRCPPVKLSKTEPLIEVWVPSVDEKLSGRFRLCWLTDSGDYFYGDAVSEYSPKQSSKGFPVYHRYLEIESTLTENNTKMGLLQTSKLFNQL